MNRRYFLSAALVGLITPQNFWKNLSFKFLKSATPNGKYLVEFATVFPTEISKPTYELEKSDYIDLQKVERLISIFQTEQRILETKTHFTGKSNHWFVLFDSQKSYNQWCDQVQLYDIYNESLRLSKKFDRTNIGLPVSPDFQLHNTSLENIAAFRPTAQILWRSVS